MNEGNYEKGEIFTKMTCLQKTSGSFPRGNALFEETHSEKRNIV